MDYELRWRRLRSTCEAALEILYDVRADLEVRECELSLVEVQNLISSLHRVLEADRQPLLFA